MKLVMIYQLAKSHNTKRPNKQNVHITKRPTMQKKVTHPKTSHNANVSLSAPTGLFNIAKEHPAAPLG